VRAPIESALSSTCLPCLVVAITFVLQVSQVIAINMPTVGASLHFYLGMIRFSVMCMVIYVGSGQPLSLIPWDESNPSFHVIELNETEQSVRQHFTKPFVYYVGAHTCCGCGFQYGEFEVEPPELALAQKSRQRLVQFLKEALVAQDTVELYACWSGDEACEPERRTELCPDDLLTTRTYFFERELLTVRHSSSP
jgi:hypothetical protein